MEEEGGAAEEEGEAGEAACDLLKEGGGWGGLRSALGWRSQVSETRPGACCSRCLGRELRFHLL